ncbi:MAG: PD-(D/E)XK nuclease family protein [Acidobacteria bacterium]|nr:PD-(D/E)XK nuclease family protein [Acidobacteriota bacterium]
MRDRVLSALAVGATLVTANRRLRRQWRADFDAAQQAAGHRTWPSPGIISWNDWLLAAHEESFSPQRLLSDFAERYLWEQIIPDQVLLDRPATAKMASQAWALLCGWRVPLDHPSFNETEDTAAFAGWARTFARHCAQKNCLSSATLADTVNPVAAELWLTGFDELTPQQQALLDRRGRPYFTADGPAGKAGSAAVAVYPDAAAELRAAAAWARESIETLGATSVGVVVQDLAARRALVESIFRETLGGELYNISLGRPLTHYPLVAAALRLLQLSFGPLPLPEAGQLLLSPFLLGGESEYRARARFDVQLRRQKRLRVAVADLQQEQEDCPRLTQALQALRAPAGAQPPSAWAATFLTLLGGAGWPGERTLDSEERQTERRWQKVLSAFAELDPWTGLLGGPAALHLFERLLSEEIFQPESAVLPVQILEALQAAGAQFDALWVQGVDDRTWPAAARPNPFLPFRMQREWRLPHASADRELEFSRKILGRLQQTAPRIVFSYAQREQETELRPSRLIRHLPPFSRELKQYPTWAGVIRAASVLETFEDAQGPALPAGMAVRAGTQAIKWQAQCPFQAFARTQLRAEPIEKPEEGIDLRDRGTMLHRALETFWNECKDHATLVSTDCTPLLERAADHAVEGLTGAMRQLERDRLLLLLREWLTVEAAREPFHVAATETRLTPRFAGLEFATRADRIDRGADGRTIIIDYKTGLVSAKSWDGARPDEPQLPIYAVTAEPTPAAVAFAQVRRGDCQWVAAPVPVAEWREVMETLAQELRDGRAAVDPKEGGKPCEYCHLQTLCRVAEVSNA